MKHEGINSTRLAEILGIQASGISHIMSGRNKPSFDFLHKLLQRFPQINPDWLLLDKGPMYRDEIKNKGGQSSSPSAGDRMFSPGNFGGASGVGDIGGGRITTTPDNRPGMVGDVGIPYTGNGMAATPAGGIGADRSVVGSGILRETPSGGLFGPDNNDIIPSGASQGAYQTGSATYRENAPAGPAQRDQAGQTAQPHSPQPSQQTIGPDVQQAASQSGSFKRSASIERIVVFYKDKTFSEYQPE